MSLPPIDKKEFIGNYVIIRALTDEKFREDMHTKSKAEIAAQLSSELSAKGVSINFEDHPNFIDNLKDVEWDKLEDMKLSKVPDHIAMKIAITPMRKIIIWPFEPPFEFLK